MTFEAKAKDFKMCPPLEFGFVVKIGNLPKVKFCQSSKLDKKLTLHEFEFFVKIQICVKIFYQFWKFWQGVREIHNFW